MSEEKNLPDFIAKGLDFKKVVVSNFHSMIDSIKSGEVENVSMSQSSTVRIITNFGMIEGKAIFPNEESGSDLIEQKDFASFMYFSINNAINTIIAKHEAEIGAENLNVMNQAGRLLLADVIITPFANPQNKFNLHRMVLFTDQIVGITIGEAQDQ